jgi:uncharacterized membrane protein YccC
MPMPDRDLRYDEIKRCLAQADAAFARAGVTADESERLALIDEAESWLVRAERRLARITDRQIPPRPSHAAPRESRSFSEQVGARREMIWRWLPRA